MIEQIEPSFNSLLKDEYLKKNLLVVLDGLDQIGQFKFQVISIIKELVDKGELKKVFIAIRYQMLPQFKEKKALTLDKLKSQSNLPKIGYIWKCIKSLTKQQLQPYNELQLILDKSLQSIAYEGLSLVLQDFSEIDFHKQSNFQDWGRFIKQIGRPSLKDNQRLIFYLSEQISTFLDAMNSFMLNQTFDLTKTYKHQDSQKGLIKNQALLKTRLKEGKSFVLNEHLNHSDYSYISDGSDDDFKRDPAIETKQLSPQVAKLSDHIPHSRNQGLMVVESCLIEENEEAISNKPMLSKQGMLGIGHQSQIFQAPHQMNPTANYQPQTMMHHRDESTATLLLEKSPLSTQRSKINLNNIMDAYNNLNKHPSVLFEEDDPRASFVMMMMPKTGRESNASINPYAMGTIDMDGDEMLMNRSIDIFRFSSIQLQNYLAAKHLLKLISIKSKDPLNLDQLIFIEQYWYVLKYLQKLIFRRSIKKNQDHLKFYLSHILKPRENIFTFIQAINHTQILSQRFDSQLNSNASLFKESRKLIDQALNIKYKALPSVLHTILTQKTTIFLAEFIIDECTRYLDMKKVHVALQMCVLQILRQSLKDKKGQDSAVTVIMKLQYLKQNMLFKDVIIIESVSYLIKLFHLYLKSGSQEVKVTEAFMGMLTEYLFNESLFSSKSNRKDEVLFFKNEATKNSINSNKSSTISSSNQVERGSVGPSTKYSLNSALKRTINLERSQLQQSKESRSVSSHSERSSKALSSNSENNNKGSFTLRMSNFEERESQLAKQQKQKDLILKERKITEEVAIKLIEIFLETSFDIENEQSQMGFIKVRIYIQQFSAF